MKKFYSLLAVLVFAFTANAQNLLTNGGFENWTDGMPDGWNGSKTNISAANVFESSDAHEGSKSLGLLNTASGHKRFTSQPIALQADTSYKLTFYIKGEGDVRGGFYNGDPESPGDSYAYGSYAAGTEGEWTEATYLFTTNDEFFSEVQVIFSVRNTSEDGLLIDSAVLEEQGEASVVDVADLGELRQGSTDGTIYRVTGQTVLMFQQSTRNQKYIEDATGGVLVDDAAGVITTAYEVGDGITGITGTLNLYNQLLQFIPTEDPGAATSTNNPVEPQVVALGDYLADPTAYESEFIAINALMISDVEEGDGTFNPGTSYDMEKGGDVLEGRTQLEGAPILGKSIPGEPVLVLGFGGRFNTTIQLFLYDIDAVLGVGDFNTAEANMTTLWKENALFSVKGKANVEIFNMSGQLVQKAEGNDSFSVNVSGLTPGVYIVKITIDGKSIAKKAVKK